MPVKSKVKISQNFVAFSEYMNFITEFEKKSKNLSSSVHKRAIKIWPLFEAFYPELHTTILCNIFYHIYFSTNVLIKFGKSALLKISWSICTNRPDHSALFWSYLLTGLVQLQLVSADCRCIAEESRNVWRFRNVITIFYLAEQFIGNSRNLLSLWSSDFEHLQNSLHFNFWSN